MDELIGRKRAHHHQARLALGCRFFPLGAGTGLGQVSLYTHSTLPWRYFNHAVVQNWECSERQDLTREVVRRMLDAGRPACFEIETALEERLTPRALLQRLTGPRTAPGSPAPSLPGAGLAGTGPPSASWIRDLKALGFVPSGELNVLVRQTAGLDRAAGETSPASSPGRRYTIRTQSRAEMESSLKKHSRMHRVGFDTPVTDPSEQDEQLLRTNLDAGVQYFWAVDEASGEPVGSVAVLAASGLAELFALSVLPAHRRQGLGRRLTLAAVSWAANAGCDLVYLETEKGSRALSLYLRLGFEPLWRQVSYLLV